ncbi:MAG: hypothetical protein R6V02_06980 [Candidatus Aminicenantes bacterium]
MSQVEMWRIKELIIILNELTEILRRGNNREWAAVFEHYKAESKQILNNKKFSSHELKNLVRNIRCGIKGPHFSPFHIDIDVPCEEPEIFKDFLHCKTQLNQILDEMDNRFFEYIN